MGAEEFNAVYTKPLFVLHADEPPVRVVIDYVKITLFSTNAKGVAVTIQ